MSNPDSKDPSLAHKQPFNLSGSNILSDLTSIVSSQLLLTSRTHHNVYIHTHAQEQVVLVSEDTSKLNGSHTCGTWPVCWICLNLSSNIFAFWTCCPNVFFYNKKKKKKQGLHFSFPAQFEAASIWLVAGVCKAEVTNVNQQHQNWEELTASIRPCSVGFFSMRASNTSSDSLRTYSRTVWWKMKNERLKHQNEGMNISKYNSDLRQRSLPVLFLNSWLCNTRALMRTVKTFFCTFGSAVQHFVGRHI